MLPELGARADFPPTAPDRTDKTTSGMLKTDKSHTKVRDAAKLLLIEIVRGPEEGELQQASRRATVESRPPITPRRTSLRDVKRGFDHLSRAAATEELGISLRIDSKLACDFLLSAGVDVTQNRIELGGRRTQAAEVAGGQGRLRVNIKPGTKGSFFGEALRLWNTSIRLVLSPGAMGKRTAM